MESLTWLLVSTSYLFIRRFFRASVYYRNTKNLQCMHENRAEWNYIFRHGDPMSVIRAIHDYVQSVLTRVSGMKILLVDSETVGIVSMVLSQSQILEQEVFLVEVIDKSNENPDNGHNMKHLKAVAILRPSAVNFIALTKELKSPRFSEYHLFFTNVVPHNRLEQLAGCDDLELVHQVQEVYADVFAINADLFSLNIPSTVSLTAQQSLWTSYEESILARIVEGIFSVAVAMRMHPLVRYTRSSPLCFKIAQLVQAKIDDEHLLFDQLGSTSQSVVLLADRRADPLTPLLNQWTYQAMCHELIGLDKNRMDLRRAPGVKPEFSEIVMSGVQDRFFEENLVSNFGDLAVNIEKYLARYQEQTKSNSKISSIEDMQRFLDQYPEFKRLSGNVSKHVTVVHELSRLVSAGNLISVSALEQEIACEEARADQYNRVSIALSDPQTQQLEKLRLVLLYSVKYAGDVNGVQQLKAGLLSIGVSQDQVALVDLLQEYCRDYFRADEVAKKNVLSLIKSAAGFGGIENVYTQHKSLLHSQLEQLLKGKLKDVAFPFMESKRRAVTGREKPNEVIAFMVGGATYEEARDVHALNQQFQSQTVILGGTNMVNSKSFLADVAQLRRLKASTPGPARD